MDLMPPEGLRRVTFKPDQTNQPTHGRQTARARLDKPLGWYGGESVDVHRGF